MLNAKSFDCEAALSIFRAFRQRISMELPHKGRLKMSDIAGRITLSIPFHEKEQAKKLGARWDPQQKIWWVPSSLDINCFARWLNTSGPLAQLYWDLAPIHESEFDDFRSSWKVEVFFVPWTCWKCKQETLVFHCAVDRGINIMPLCYQAKVLEQLDRFRKNVGMERFGCIKPRYSRTLGASYVSQGCRHCDALIGEFPLSEDFSEFLSTQDVSAYPLRKELHWSLLGKRS